MEKTADATPPHPHPGQYADALSRGTKVCLILVESLGGIYYASKVQLLKLSKRAIGDPSGHRDSGPPPPPPLRHRSYTLWTRHC
eukprot:scaffold270_cov121-Isochrysis_galbana.AAC.5